MKNTQICFIQWEKASIFFCTIPSCSATGFQSFRGKTHPLFKTIFEGTVSHRGLVDRLDSAITLSVIPFTIMYCAQTGCPWALFLMVHLYFGTHQK